MPLFDLDILERDDGVSVHAIIDHLDGFELEFDLPNPQREGGESQVKVRLFVNVATRDMLTRTKAYEEAGKKMAQNITAQEKNLCNKTRDKEHPYEVWATPQGWIWRVLRKYKKPSKEAVDRYAKWLCFATSPMCPEGEYGDTYVRDIERYAMRFSTLVQAQAYVEMFEEGRLNGE